jgi:hypothetical protein
MNGSRLWSGALVLALVLFCAATRWGRTYPRLVHRTGVVLSTGLGLTAEERRVAVYDETYPVLLYIRDNTPPDAVVCLPPRRTILDRTEMEAPILASASSAYNVLHPRVPVHWGDPSPLKDRMDYLLVWEHWGLDMVDPDAPRDEESRVRLYPLPPGTGALW